MRSKNPQERPNKILQSRLSIKLNSLRSPGFSIENVENHDKPDEELMKNSFVATQDSVFDLSSFINENTMNTMKNVIDLEEKKQRTRKALFQKRYLKEYPIDYRPKAVTDNKCMIILEKG